MKKNTGKYIKRAIWSILLVLPLITYTIHTITHEETTIVETITNTYNEDNYEIKEPIETSKNTQKVNHNRNLKQHMEEYYGLKTNTGDIVTQLIDNSTFKEFIDTINITEDTLYTVFYIGEWLIVIEIIQLITDIIMWLPRLTKKWLNRQGMENEE